MVMLQNFPLLQQSLTVEASGAPAPDAEQSSLATALLAGVQFLHADAPLQGLLSEAVFLQQPAAALTDIHLSALACAPYGDKLWSYRDMPAALVARIHQELHAGHPVIGFEPDRTVSASLGWIHALVFYGEEPGFLTAMDPWTGRPVRRPDEEWGQLLLDNQIWVLEKMTQAPALVPPTPTVTIASAGLDLSMPAVAEVFQTSDPPQHSWFCPSTGKHLDYDFLAFYRMFKAGDLTALNWLGLPVSDAVPLGSGVAKQHFEKAVLLYEQGAITPLNLYDGGPGTDPLLIQLQTELLKIQKGTNS